MTKGGHHRFKLFRLILQLGNMRVGDRPYLGVPPIPVMPQLKQLSDALNGKP